MGLLDRGYRRDSNGNLILPDEKVTREIHKETYIDVEARVKKSYEDGINSINKPFSNVQITENKEVSPEERMRFAQKMVENIRFATEGYDSNINIEYFNSNENEYHYSGKDFDLSKKETTASNINSSVTSGLKQKLKKEYKKIEKLLKIKSK